MGFWSRKGNIVRKYALLVAFSVLLVSCGSVFATGGDMGVSTEPLTDGSADYPYLIEDFNDFQAFCADPCYWDDYVRLDCDLDLDPNLQGRIIYTQAPIGTDIGGESFWTFLGTAYTGSFDGNGHVINNLTINGNSYCGLFGKIDHDSEIKNLGLLNVLITGSGYYVSGLAGVNRGGNITGCYSGGNVAGGDYAGGLVGESHYGDIISNCYSTCNINGESHVGGLVGNNSVTTITNCYSSGTVAGDYSVGGLVGENGRGSIINSYSTGSVNGNDRVGGLSGENYYGTIISCYSSGAVNGDEGVGGFVGPNNYGSIINCYWDKDTSGQPTSAGGEAKSTVEMKDGSTFIGWNDGSWTIDQGVDYPHLSWENSAGVPITTDYPTATYIGSGSEGDPFVLSTALDIVCMSQRACDWDSYFIMSNDINMADVNYVPVVKFSGNFDGNSFSISSLNVDSENINADIHVGLFGRLTGRIKNLGLENVMLSSSSVYNSVGAAVGYNSGDITNCYSSGNIIGRKYVGGLVGENSHGIITGCHSSASVNGNYYVGGLVGRNDYNGIRKCYSIGSVTGGDYVGGFIGENYFYGIIARCFSSGAVNGDEVVGGFVGRNFGGYIGRCYSTGEVTGDSYARGFVGKNERDGVVNISFWDVNTSGIGVSGDDNYGTTGKTTLEMQTESTFTDAGWDFDENDGDAADWYMLIDGYPKLLWQFPIGYIDQAVISVAMDYYDTAQIEVYCPIYEVVNWTISGDELCGWITNVDPNSGSSSVSMGITTVNIDIDTTGLGEGDYMCELILEADNGDNIVVLVSLHVYNRVDFEEFALLMQYWGMVRCYEGRPCENVDWYVDGQIDMKDLNQLAIGWLGEEVVDSSNWEIGVEDFRENIIVER